MFSLTIQLPYEVRRVEVPARQHPRLLSEVLHRSGIPLNTRCGQRGLCDGCWVQLAAGHLLESGTGVPVASGTLVRGCQVYVPEDGAATVQVPARSLLAHQPQVLASFRLNVPRAHDPLWQRMCIEPGEIADTDVLSEVLIAGVSARLDCELPLRWDGSADAIPSLPGGCVDLAVEHRGDHRVLRACTLDKPPYGVVVDIGTTTVVVALVELGTGRVMATASALNAQNSMGDNVLTRINACRNQPLVIKQLQHAIVSETLSPLILKLIDQLDATPEQLVAMVVAGNTTMLHLLLGVDPTSLGTVPFTPAFLEHRILPASELSLSLSRAPASAQVVSAETGDGDAADPNGAQPQDDVSEMAIHVLPGAAAYVGADITAGVLASGMAYRNENCLLVDLGTNGELVIRHDGQFVGCATAAGPAFEGAGLAFGMGAVDGAIGHIWLDHEGQLPRVEVIGQGKPVGICGTAYVDFVARARQMGLISPTARFVSAHHPAIIEHETYGRALVVADRDEAEPLLITEADMALLLQAKAAIAAGIRCLLRQVNLQPEEVNKVYLAGGFGFHMHVDSLLGCGMLPGFRSEQVEAVGNTALAGAYLTLLDSGALRELCRTSARMEIIELNLQPDFEMIYIDELSLA